MTASVKLNRLPQKPADRQRPSQMKSCEHAPVTGSQESSVHRLASAHAGPPTTQTPLSQLSIVHGSPSSQRFVLSGVKTQPVAGLQVSSVHSLLSLQAIAVKTHPSAGLQLFVVQALESSHTTGV